MRHLGKKNVLGILINAIDYEAALDTIFAGARNRRPVAVSALAVHGIMTGVMDAEHRHRLNTFELLVPDGQPVKWVLNWLHSTRLTDRVRGPSLTMMVCERAAAEGEPLYIYGSTPTILEQLEASLRKLFPSIVIAGMEPSKFRRMTVLEKDDLVRRVKASGATVMLVGLGCPRQEIFTYELRNELSMPVLAVGAAFPFIAGLTPEAPAWMQHVGLEWLFRLFSEPRRLWRRYLYLNPAYLFLVALQATKLTQFATKGTVPVSESLFG